MSIDTAQDIRTAPIEVTVSWTHADVIPPGCRKPRDIHHSDEKRTVEVREVAADAAPIAFVTGGTTIYTRPDTWRSFDGSYWIDRHSGIGAAMQRERHHSAFTSELQMLHALRRAAADFLLINGELWERTSAEPTYKIETYHWGSRASVEVKLFDPKDSQAAPDGVFPADAFQAAQAAALAIIGMGEDAAYARERIEQQEPGIDVHEAGVLPRSWSVAIDLDFPDPWAPGTPLEHALTMAGSITAAGLAIFGDNPLHQQRWMVVAGALSSGQAASWAKAQAEARVSEHDLLEHVATSR